MRLDEGDRVVTLACAEREEDEEDTATPLWMGQEMEKKKPGRRTQEEEKSRELRSRRRQTGGSPSYRLCLES